MGRLMREPIFNFILFLGSIAASILFGLGAATAGSQTANLTVSIQITASCTISTAALTFPSTAASSLLTTAVTSSANVSVTCTSGSPYSIAMDNGANYSTTRRMALNSSYISYGLYVDSGLTHAWTTASSSTSCTSSNSCYLGTGTGTAQSIPIYGQVPTVATAPAAGTYTDTVMMTITY